MISACLPSSYLRPHHLQKNHKSYSMSDKWFRDRMVDDSVENSAALALANRYFEFDVMNNLACQLEDKCNVESRYKSESSNLLPNQFLDKYSLPRIVQITPEEPIAANETLDPATLFNGTLLLYKQYRSGKIEAKKFNETRNLSRSQILEYNKEHNYSTIVIPDTYQGWFSVVTERGQIKARLYTTIQRLITAQVTGFLITGSDLIGYVQNYKKNADTTRHQYIKTTIKSGQTLKLLAVYEDIAEQSTRSKRLSWPLLGNKQHSTQYAQCITNCKQVVYVPVTTHGNFYAISTANHTADDNVSKVYQISKLLRVFPLPVRVCCIYPNKINGSMLLETYRKEDVMLACILDDKSGSKNRFRFLEIDTNSKFYVARVPNERRLFKTACIQEALRRCHDDSDKWCQQLKVIHHIYPHSAVPDPPKPVKKQRKVSLGDKRTVKSASFRYSTGYGDEIRPLFKEPPPDRPPVYLNISNKPNEENCSSLPAQKPDRTAFEKEIARSVAENERSHARSSADNACAAVERLERLTRIFGKSKCSYHKSVVGRQQDTRNYPGIDSEVVAYQQTVTNTNMPGEDNTSETNSQIKSHVAVIVDDSYSNTVDAIRSSSSKDNIYAEIGEYRPQEYEKYPLSFSKKVACNAPTSYRYLQSTSRVNVS